MFIKKTSYLEYEISHHLLINPNKTEIGSVAPRYNKAIQQVSIHQTKQTKKPENPSWDRMMDSLAIKTIDPFRFHRWGTN